MQSENVKMQGDKLQPEKWATSSSAWKSELENRPVDYDLEKKQGDPLMTALPSVPTGEPFIGKLVKELPVYHQGELLQPTVQTEAEIKVADATASIEATKEALSDAKHVAQEKASELYQSASHQAEVLIDRAYQNEQHLEKKVGSAISAAYSAVANVASVAIEKGKDGLHYLGKEVYELSDSMADKTDHAIEKVSQTAHYLNEKKDQVIQMAAEKAQAAIESISEPIEGPMDYGTQDKEMSPEGFKDLEQAIKKFERSASFHLEQQQAALEQQDYESEPTSEVASTLQMIADEAQEPLSQEAPHDNATEFMKLEEKEAEELKRIQQKAISEEKVIQREKQFVRRLSEDLTDSLRASAIEFKKHQLDDASEEEMKPLLGVEPQAQTTI